MNTLPELDNLLAAYSRENDGIGLQVAVIAPDGAIWRSVAGYADLERKCAMLLEHHVYLGSMTNSGIPASL